jgi:hypothetical protein
MDAQEHPNPYGWNDEKALEIKRQFAIALAQEPDNEFEAARKVIPEPEYNGRANWVALEWADDPYVISLIEERVATMGAASVLTSKEEFARNILIKMRGVKDPGTWLQFAKTYGETMGYINRGGGGVHINNNNNMLNAPKVMVLPPKRSLEEWTIDAVANSKKIQAL